MSDKSPACTLARTVFWEIPLVTCPPPQGKPGKQELAALQGLIRYTFSKIKRLARLPGNSRLS